MCLIVSRLPQTVDELLELPWSDLVRIEMAGAVIDPEKQLLIVVIVGLCSFFQGPFHIFCHLSKT